MSNLLWARSCRWLFRRNMSTPSSGAPPKPSASTSPSASLNQRYRPSNLEKTLLVWTKKFKTKEEIPQFVSADLLERARSQARIKIANYLMLLTVLASIGAVFAGKSAAKRGESVQQMNLDWHQQYRDEFKKNEQDAAK